MYMELAITKLASQLALLFLSDQGEGRGRLGQA